MRTIRKIFGKITGLKWQFWATLCGVVVVLGAIHIAFSA